MHSLHYPGLPHSHVIYETHQEPRHLTWTGIIKMKLLAVLWDVSIASQNVAMTTKRLGHNEDYRIAYFISNLSSEAASALALSTLG